MGYDKIKLENISLQISQKQILRNINLSLETGKIHVFFGKSGSGKTSILNILNFLYTPSTGRVYYNDIIVNIDDENQINALRCSELAYFQQEMAFIENLTSIENLEIFAKIKKVSLDVETIENYAKKLNIFNLLQENISVLSGGERQRAAFLKLLALPSQVVLIDEPTNNLDKENVDFIIQGIQVMKAQRKTIIIASHSEAILNIADFVHLMEDINEI